MTELPRVLDVVPDELAWLMTTPTARPPETATPKAWAVCARCILGRNLDALRRQDRGASADGCRHVRGDHGVGVDACRARRRSRP